MHKKKNTPMPEVEDKMENKHTANTMVTMARVLKRDIYDTWQTGSLRT